MTRPLLVRGTLLSELRDLLHPGCLVAVGDGAGLPRAALDDLATAAREVGDVRLLLGWMLQPMDELDLDAFSDVATLMGGYGARRPIDEGRIRYLPVRLGTAPALLTDVLRPDVLLTSVVESVGGHRLTTEQCWQAAVVHGGARVAAVVRPNAPDACAGPPLPADQVVVVGEDEQPPIAWAWDEPSEVHLAIAERVAGLVPPGARVQHGPGGVGTAVVRALRHPVHLDSGVITEEAVGLDRRGLLLGPPVATYITGAPELYAWAHRRAVLHPLEVTHDPGRLAQSPPLVAVNTALEIDVDGQVNVEAVGGSAVAGIGGHPDFAAAAARQAGGLSVIALQSARGRHRTLVETLSAPVSTPSHDVEVVVTEHGVADLRGLARAERRRALRDLWDGA